MKRVESAHTAQKAVDYIEAHLREPLELAEIAAAAHMSIPDLYRAFRALTGYPLRRYIRNRRTSEACRLLRQTDLPVMDIAFASGFESYRALVDSFKQLTGLTPQTYRDGLTDRPLTLERPQYAPSRGSNAKPARGPSLYRREDAYGE